MTWRIIQNFFQITKWKDVWSSLEFPHCFSWQITPPDSAGHPRGAILLSSCWRTLLLPPPSKSVFGLTHCTGCPLAVVPAPPHVLCAVALVSPVRCRSASAQVLLTALWQAFSRRPPRSPAHSELLYPHDNLSSLCLGCDFNLKRFSVWIMYIPLRYMCLFFFLVL